MGRRRTQKQPKKSYGSELNIFECPKCGNKSIKIHVDNNEGNARLYCFKNICNLEDTIDGIDRSMPKRKIYEIWIDNFYKKVGYVEE